MIHSAALLWAVPFSIGKRRFFYAHGMPGRQDGVVEAALPVPQGGFFEGILGNLERRALWISICKGQEASISCEKETIPI